MGAVQPVTASPPAATPPEASAAQPALARRNMTDRSASCDAHADDRDLLELLQELGFGHWHSALLLLFDRYRGWLSHYWMDPGFELDFWPVGDVIKALVELPPSQAGNDLAFALALSECDFLVRLARDEVTGEVWDALAQPYADFTSTHRADPYWGITQPWSTDAFVRWMLSQLPPPSSSSQDTPGLPQG